MLAICEDRDGAIWIGTGGGGLNRLKDGKITAYTAKDGLPNDRIWSLQSKTAAAISGSAPTAAA